MHGNSAPGSVDFSAVYRDYYAFMCRRLLRWGVPQRDLEDVVHEAFLVVHRRLPEIRAPEGMAAWLAAIAFRVASDWRRRAFQRQDLSVPVPEVEDTRQGPESLAARSQAMQQLMRVLEEMDEEKRVVFVLHELEGMDVPSIASGLCILVPTAYSRLRLARNQFTTLMRKVRGEEPA